MARRKMIDKLIKKEEITKPMDLFSNDYRKYSYREILQ